MLTITAATRNPAKIKELSGLLDGIARVELGPHDISPEIQNEPAAETGESVDEIARAKAIAWSRTIGDDRLVIATDGGLLIPAVDRDWNPVKTRRFAGEKASDLDRARALISMTAQLASAARQIGWRESVTIARKGVIAGQWTAESDPGFLAVKVDECLVASCNGFWVPAIWRCPEFEGRLLAELSDSDRAQRIDHWTRLRALVRSWAQSVVSAPS